MTPAERTVRQLQKDADKAAAKVAKADKKLEREDVRAIRSPGMSERKKRAIARRSPGFLAGLGLADPGPEGRAVNALRREQQDAIAALAAAKVEAEST